MLPASAIPVIFGVESFVADELANEFGASGAVVSGSPIVIDKGDDNCETLPAASVAVAVKE